MKDLASLIFNSPYGRNDVCIISKLLLISIESGIIEVNEVMEDMEVTIHSMITSLPSA